MRNGIFPEISGLSGRARFWVLLILAVVLASFFAAPEFFSTKVINDIKNVIADSEENQIPVLPPLDTVAYDKKLSDLANNPPDPIVYNTVKTVETDKNGKSVTKTTKVPISPQPVVPHLWPVKTVYPNAGAILPFNRIVAYYGNLYSNKMGALGEYSEDVMLAKLGAEVAKWNTADPTTPAVPALHYIAVVAQEKPGDDGKYRARMPDSEIDKVMLMAAKINALVFLDIQVGFSNLQTEVPLLLKYLKMPNVHLGVDPEFSMKGNIRPGKVVGTYDAADINFAAEYLAEIVRENNLTPKIFVVHRYTQKMLTNFQNIKPLPEVQMVINMDGWGEQARKMNTYKQFIYKEPVQFAGFKLFYKNDVLVPGTVLMTPDQLLKLNPQPIYIQYQ